MADYVLIGAICGSIFQIVVCVGVISGCVALCCWCHKKCRRRRQRQNGVNVVYVPAPAPPAGYPPSYPPSYPPPRLNYHHVPPPIPSAPPPSYLEATSPGVFPMDVSQMPLMHPASPQSDLNPRAFNPDYGPPKPDRT